MKTITLDADHRYWDETGKELYGVTATIKQMWPSTNGAPEHVIENARERGAELDALVTSYLNGTLHAIPAGIREDTKELFLKFLDWWGICREARDWGKVTPQVMLSDGEYAGTCDLLFENGTIIDIKCKWDLDFQCELQLGGYADLYLDNPVNHPAICEVGILHLTKRLAKPKLIMLNEVQCVQDWRTIRDMHRLLRRAK